MGRPAITDRMEGPFGDALGSLVDEVIPLVGSGESLAGPIENAIPRFVKQRIARTF